MNKSLTKQEKIYMGLRAVLVLVIFAIFVWATIAILPLISKLGDVAYRMQFKEYIDSMGFKGVLILLGLQIIQIVVAVIPGQPIEILSGMLYGNIGGILVSLVGIFIGTTFIFVLVRKVGTDFMQLFFSKESIEKIENSKIFKNPQKFELLMLIIFIIPFIPKDIFIYLGGISPVRAKRFLMIATLGRIPGLVIAVYMGDKLYQGNFGLVAILTVLVIVIGIVGYYISSKAHKKLEEES
jgi:uncharacterized membrane protein YdjX (TVP38/TMEM64 family)